MSHSFRRVVAGLLLVTMSMLAVPLPAQAAMIETDAAVAGGKARLASALERAEVRAQLEALGVNPMDVKARVNALGDDEAARIAGQLDSLAAGGDGIIGAIVFIFVLLLITDILGLTKIFPFTRSVR
jgi:hypothetical protein